MSKIGFIYKITSPSEKVYIGESYNLKARLEKYKKNNCKKQPRLYASLNKYGWEAHIFEVIEECEIEELYCRERYWQDEFEVLGEKGLNCILTECSEENIKRVDSEETKAKKRMAQKSNIAFHTKPGELNPFYGKKHTEETKKIISEKAKERLKNIDGYWLNKQLPDETKQKISEARKKSKCAEFGKNPKAKLVLDIEMGVFYDCLSEACIALNLKYGTVQSSILEKRNRKNKTSLRYV